MLGLQPSGHSDLSSNVTLTEACSDLFLKPRPPPTRCLSIRFLICVLYATLTPLRWLCSFLVYLLTVLPLGCHLQGRDKAWPVAFTSVSLSPPRSAVFCKHGLSLSHFGEGSEIQWGGGGGKTQDLESPWSISQERESAPDLETPWVWLPRHAVPG